MRNVSPVVVNYFFYFGMWNDFTIRYNFIPTSQAKNLKLLDVPECIHLIETGRCKIMSVRQCAGKTCSFIQRSINILSSEEKRARRLNSLDEETQFGIAKKYYDGRMPWKQ